MTGLEDSANDIGKAAYSDHFPRLIIQDYEIVGGACVESRCRITNAQARRLKRKVTVIVQGFPGLKTRPVGCDVFQRQLCFVLCKNGERYICASDFEYRHD